MHIICLFVASIKDAGKKFQLANVKDVNYRIEETPSESKNVSNNHAYEYDANGNLVYVNTSRTKKDGVADEKTAERKLKWDEENRLLASDDNGFVTNYWYDADGERTVKTSGESDQVYVNSEFAGGRTNTAKFSLYVSPYLVANQGGRYTKHIYIGSQRVVSKIGDFDSYGSDPRRIQYAGSETDGLSVDYKQKYVQQLQVIKDNYATFAVPYNGEDNNDYVDGKGFCCNDGSLEAAQTRALARAAKNNFQEGDTYEKMQFFYHPDHLGSSSYITNLEGEVVQHIEYVPFGEVFIEERNNIWNTPYLFNAKEFDEETGLYYYGARYYEPRLSLWMSVDPISNYDPLNSENFLDGQHNGGIYNYANLNPYVYCYNRSTVYIDPNGKQGFSGVIFGGLIGGFTEYASIVGSKMLFDNKTFKEANKDLDLGDVASISINTGLGAASGFIDNGISRMTNWIAKPTNRKIVTKLLENGIDMVGEALSQYIETGEISISSMLVGALAEVGMGKLIGEKYVKKALGEAKNAVSAAEKRLADLSNRRYPNAKLIHKAQEDLNSAKQFYGIIKGLDIGSETAKKTVSKGASDRIE